MKRLSLFTVCLLLISFCISSVATSNSQAQTTNDISVGAQQIARYLPLLVNKHVALVANQSSLVGNIHLLDLLLDSKVNVVSVMSPEHGFRGEAGAGVRVSDNTDTKTGTPIHSLYGNTKKPTTEMLQGIDTIVFDLQDVGVRFYTYLSTLHYVLEAASEHNIHVVVLDRPNPNGRFVDGPVLQNEFSSFVGIHPIPVLHGMTLGELALMIKGEGWIENADALSLSIIPVANYHKAMPYDLPVAPSPNLPNSLSIQLYPTLCFFEGTSVSIGRGTDLPFQLMGHHQVSLGDTKIKVNPNRGAPNPKLNGQTLEASVFSTTSFDGLNIELLIETHAAFEQAGVNFFDRPRFFDLLAGSSALREAIQNNQSADEIRQLWQQDLAEFMTLRAPYLLYPATKN